MGDDAAVTTTGPAPAASGLAAYRDVLRLPGVGAVTALAFGARIPATAVGVTVTLHVVLTLGHGFAAAGLVAAAITTGMAVGAPVLGVVVDRFGLRPAVLTSLVVSAAFWTVAPLLDYGLLLVVAFAGRPVRTTGVLADPPDPRRGRARGQAPAGVRAGLDVGRDVIHDRTRAGLAADARAGQHGHDAADRRGVRAGRDRAAGARPARQHGRAPARGRRDHRCASGCAAPLVGALLAITAAIVAIMGTELAFIAALTRGGEAWAIAVVNAVWCVASLVGGFAYGAARRSISLPVLLGALGVATLPAALGGPWWSFALLLLGAGLCTAPTLAAGSNAVAELGSERVRGIVTGLQGSATTAGMAIATPLSGAAGRRRVARPVAILVCAAVAVVDGRRVGGADAQPRSPRPLP